MDWLLDVNNSVSHSIRQDSDIIQYMLHLFDGYLAPTDNTFIHGEHVTHLMKQSSINSMSPSMESVVAYGTHLLDTLTTASTQQSSQLYSTYHLFRLVFCERRQGPPSLRSDRDVFQIKPRRCHTLAPH